MHQLFECRLGLRLKDCVLARYSIRVSPASESTGVALAASMLLGGS
jgi:hypothetical protein